MFSTENKWFYRSKFSTWKSMNWWNNFMAQWFLFNLKDNCFFQIKKIIRKQKQINHECLWFCLIFFVCLKSLIFHTEITRKLSEWINNLQQKYLVFNTSNTLVFLSFRLPILLISGYHCSRVNLKYLRNFTNVYKCVVSTLKQFIKKYLLN